MQSKSRVLLIEDDAFLSEGYIFFLKNGGFDVTYAPGAEEGLAILEKNKKKPDIILLDLIMPGMNGFEMLEALKKKKNFRDIPVIIISNLGQESDILECKRLGAVDFIIKSNLSMNEVVAKINTILSSKQATKK